MEKLQAIFLFKTKADQLRSLLRSLERQFLGDNYRYSAPMEPEILWLSRLYTIVK
ncbi:hypothetical protein MATR_06130 [Marivirga tractuosa]|uniref:Uncharacterized protein n=1 Tax=Marivirga tractuosa (strain ATCC 23168 / DSM 4126 / NBRC 15989 / NCIMB 1408 / VKM B-1430 / H-43) TaxID=643867 RepID=E4TRN3_MARTH|nr:hypothetical protein Ftrac_1766 [Marivirga tractuosa DSM 4126]BDD13788.1 hypothetical protein MATR_06130 [Marivirga tractuosa]